MMTNKRTPWLALLAIVASVATTSCSSMGNASTACGGSGEPCCNGTACNAGLSCNGPTCSGSTPGSDAGSSSGASVPGGSLRLEAPKAVAHLPPLDQADAGACGPDGYCPASNECGVITFQTSQSYDCCPAGTLPCESSSTPSFLSTLDPSCPASCETSSWAWCCPSGSTCSSEGCQVGAGGGGDGGLDFGLTSCSTCGDGYCCGSVCEVTQTLTVDRNNCAGSPSNILTGPCPAAEPVDCGGTDGGAAGNGCCGADTQCCSAGQCCPNEYACCGDGQTCCPPGTTCSGNGCLATGASTITVYTTCPAGFPIDCSTYCCNFGTCCAQGCCG